MMDFVNKVIKFLVLWNSWISSLAEPLRALQAWVTAVWFKLRLSTVTREQSKMRPRVELQLSGKMAKIKTKGTLTINTIRGLCNKNQLNALFILSLSRHSTSTCFGHICSPSSGGILYIYSNWYVLCFLVDCLLAGLGWNWLGWNWLGWNWLGWNWLGWNWLGWNWLGWNWLGWNRLEWNWLGWNWFHPNQFNPNPANCQSTKKHNTYQLLYIYSIPPDDGLQICPKHVEVDWRDTLRINSASSWFYYTDMSRCMVNKT